MYAVIPDGERLGLGKNEISAVFRYEIHANKFGASMWEKYYIIQEVEVNI